MSISESSSDLGGGSGGYDYDCVERPPQECVCPVCLLLLRDPVLTACCGNHFCRACVRPIVAQGKSCPLCNERNVSTMLDKFFNRKVLAIRVRCPFAKHGCTWEGELQQVEAHTNTRTGSCSSIAAPCTQCKNSIKLSDMGTHKVESCPERQFACEHCNKRGTFRSISEKHWPVCEQFPVCCPNECGEKFLPRVDVSKHLDKECPLTHVKCEFAFAGCQVSTPRKLLSQHLETHTVSHLSMMAKHLKSLEAELTIKGLKIQCLETEAGEREARCKELEREVKTLKDSAIESGATAASPEPSTDLSLACSTHDTPANLRCVPVELVLEDFFSLKDARNHWYSKAFYSRPGGYRMFLKVYADGYGDGDGSHVSVYTHLMRGDYDDELSWPFSGVVHIKIDNLPWVKSCTDIVCDFDPLYDRCACERVYWPDARNEIGVGFDTLLPHHCLPYHRVSSLIFVVRDVVCYC